MSDAGRSSGGRCATQPGAHPYSALVGMSTDPLAAAVERSRLVRDAFSEARRAHRGQVRDTGNGEIPFIEHSAAVAARLAEHRYPDEVVAAALLHDVIEKGGAEHDQLRARFGERVAWFVGALTEDAAIESYRERKDEHRSRVAQAGAEARAIFAADKLVNVRVLREAYAVNGERSDAGLRVPLDAKLRTWELDLEMLSEAEPGLELVRQLGEELTGLRRERSGSAAATG